MFQIDLVDLVLVFKERGKPGIRRNTACVQTSPPLRKITERRGVCTQARRKTSRSKGENQQQTQPTYGVDAEIWTRATLVGGECPYHCTTLALIETWTCAQVDLLSGDPTKTDPGGNPEETGKIIVTSADCSRCRRAKQAGKQRKSDWMSERKKRQQDSGFHTSHQRIDLFTKQNFQYCSRLSACGPRAHLKAGGKEVLRFIAMELCTSCTARQRFEWQYGGREG